MFVANYTYIGFHAMPRLLPARCGGDDSGQPSQQKMLVILRNFKNSLVLLVYMLNNISV